MRVTEVSADAPIKGGILDAIMEEFAPKSNTFDVILPDGTTFPFRRLNDGAEKKELSQRAIAFATSFKKIKGKKPPLKGEWVDLWVDDQGLYAQIFVLGELALHPEIKGNHLGLLKLYRTAGPIFDAIIHQVDAASINLLGRGEQEIVDEEKKD